MFRSFLIILFLLFGVSTSVLAGDKSDRKAADHELAMTALKNGDVLPIMKILALTQKYQPGEVIEVELESKKGKLYYEVEILSPSGVIMEIKVDARTGRLLKEAKEK